MVKAVEKLSGTLEVWVYCDRVDIVERFGPGCVRVLYTVPWDRLISMHEEVMVDRHGVGDADEVS